MSQHILMAHDQVFKCALVFENQVVRLCVLDVTISEKVFYITGIYAPSDHAVRPVLFRPIVPFPAISIRVTLTGFVMPSLTPI